MWQTKHGSVTRKDKGIFYRSTRPVVLVHQRVVCRIYILCCLHNKSSSVRYELGSPRSCQIGSLSTTLSILFLNAYFYPCTLGWYFVTPSSCTNPQTETKSFSFAREIGPLQINKNLEFRRMGQGFGRDFFTPLPCCWMTMHMCTNNPQMGSRPFRYLSLYYAVRRSAWC